MRTSWLAVALSIVPFSVGAQQTLSSPLAVEKSVTPYTVKERGPHDRVWERTEYETGPNGEQRPHLHSYTELATGMHYRDTVGEWQESNETIELLPNGAGAAASHGQHKVVFPANLLGGLIELNTPDNKWLRSQVLGLAYFDSSSGQNVLIAELKDCVGKISGNQVIYEDAFTDFKADVRYTYTRAGFEQDIILRERPPGPEAYGLNPASTKIEVLTEFVNPPQPSIEQVKLPGVNAESIADATLNFGVMRFGQGKAFILGENASKVPVSKQWLKLEGRDFLLEEVPVSQLQGQLEVLPQISLKSIVSKVASIKRVLPTRKLAQSRKGEMTVASQPKGLGLVLDYITVNSGSIYFKSDTTYYVSGGVSASGIEGGTVIKYANSSDVYISTEVGFFSGIGPYRPVILTSMDDDTVGETISGSTGNPINTGAMYLNFSNSGDVGKPIKYLRISYAGSGIATAYGACPIWHCQFIKCGTGIIPNPYSGSCTQELHNVLFSQCDYGVQANVYVVGEHVTGDRIDTFFNVNSWCWLTNCVLTGVTNIFNPYADDTPGATLDHCITNDNGNGIYQTVGGGQYYLTDGSTNRNAGTTNINAALLIDLKTRTTYPPIAYTNVTFTNAQTFSPQAQRDIDLPDLGYHYDPLDWVFGGCMANSNFNFTAGTAVGWFRTSSDWYHAGHGIHLDDRQTASFNGTAENSTYWVRLNTVQEQDSSAGYGPGGISGWAYPTIADSPQVIGRFMRCSMLAGESGNHFRDDYGYLNVSATHCEFWGGSLGGYIIFLNYTNCLLDRCVTSIEGDDVGGRSFVMKDCTMHGSLLQINRWDGAGWSAIIKDSAFDGTTFVNDGATNSVSYDYNAFLQGSNRLSPNGLHDVIVTNSFNWKAGPLGNFYLPTNSTLINVGSTNANLLGLYHFTTQTNQVKETNSMVDIGYHYVAVNTNSVPIDTDGDGIPDYLEDANGNGISDSGDLANWRGSVNDTNGVIRLQVYTPLK